MRLSVWFARALFALVLVAPAAARAQLTIILEGAVRGPERQAVTQGNVTVVNPATNEQRTAPLSDAGRFRVLGLAPGVKGFARHGAAATVEIFNVFNTNNVAGYNGRQRDAAGVLLPSYGQANAAFGARRAGRRPRRVLASRTKTGAPLDASGAPVPISGSVSRCFRSLSDR